MGLTLTTDNHHNGNGSWRLGITETESRSPISAQIYSKSPYPSTISISDCSSISYASGIGELSSHFFSFIGDKILDMLDNGFVLYRVQTLQYLLGHKRIENIFTEPGKADRAIRDLLVLSRLHSTSKALTTTSYPKRIDLSRQATRLILKILLFSARTAQFDSLVSCFEKNIRNYFIGFFRLSKMNGHRIRTIIATSDILHIFIPTPNDVYTSHSHIKSTFDFYCDRLASCLGGNMDITRFPFGVYLYRLFQFLEYHENHLRKMLLNPSALSIIERSLICVFDKFEFHVIYYMLPVLLPISNALKNLFINKFFESIKTKSSSRDQKGQTRKEEYENDYISAPFVVLCAIWRYRLYLHSLRASSQEMLSMWPSNAEYAGAFADIRSLTKLGTTKAHLAKSDIASLLREHVGLLEKHWQLGAQLHGIEDSSQRYVDFKECLEVLNVLEVIDTDVNAMELITSRWIVKGSALFSRDASFSTTLYWWAIDGCREESRTNNKFRHIFTNRAAFDRLMIWLGVECAKEDVDTIMWYHLDPDNDWKDGFWHETVPSIRKSIVLCSGCNTWRQVEKNDRFECFRCESKFDSSASIDDRAYLSWEHQEVLIKAKLRENLRKTRPDLLML